MAQTAVVVGAAGGAGSAVATELLKAGYDVVGTVLNDHELQLAREAAPGIRRLTKIDLGDERSVARGMDAILKDRHIAKLAGVVVCAAISPFGPLEISSLSALRKTLEINTIAAVGIYQKAMPYLRRSKGRFIVTSSMGGKLAIPFIGHYAASKFALEGLADIMRREAARFGVKVIVIEPGSIKTGMMTDQIRLVQEAHDRLSGEQRKLYGRMYTNWKRVVAGGAETAFPASTVAKVVRKAMTAKNPATRYLSDPVAQSMVAMARKSSDAALDKFMKRTFG